ncbi:Protein kinase-like domain [Pseudocohnilembus persalinus]|uniref:Protein kinase-like domain n=1 Tax=Pseudocohnilembus persalinus TaxID=266149 RepID=A0A0V0QI68_PSEPJ|nr:Protein kinase-like domain [Pseudocohnilembus persalinus]|eukprot:KRX01884.1 Protein kinase-like domain [Pseudocohnilembus persalinus]
MEKESQYYKLLVRHEVQLKGYHFEQELGQGQFGVVIKASINGQFYAIKAINKQQFKRIPKLKELTNNEINVLTHIRNQNVLYMKEHFETKSNHYLVTEYCNDGDMGGFLFKLRQNKQLLTENEALGYFTQILNGFQALHERSIVHRDIKLDNILRHKTQNGVLLKIGDLGFAKELKDAQSLTTTALGTAITKAPEIIEKKPYGLEVDLYSCGVILYQLVYGIYPFIAKTEKQLLEKVKQGRIQFNFKGVHVSDELKDMLYKMLQYDRSKRITWSELYEHKLFLKPEVRAMLLNSFRESQLKLHNLIDFYEKQQILTSYQLEGYYEQGIQTNIIDGKSKDGYEVCIKEIQKEQLYQSQKLKESFELMVEISADDESMTHNIINIFEIKDSPDAFYLIQEYCQLRSVGYQIEKLQKSFSEYDTLDIFLQLLNAFKYLHSRNIIHRNLQADHILLQANNQVRLTGLRYIEKINFEQSILSQSIAGTNKYQEDSNQYQQQYDYTQDIYSLGMLMYYMMFKRFPVQKNQLDNIIKNKKIHYINYDDNSIKISELMKNLLSRMLDYRVETRIRFQEIFQHPIFEKYNLKGCHNFNQNFNFYQEIEIKQITIPDLLTESNFSLKVKSLIFPDPPKLFLIHEQSSQIQIPKENNINKNIKNNATNNKNQSADGQIMMVNLQQKSQSFTESTEQDIKDSDIKFCNNKDYILDEQENVQKQIDELQSDSKQGYNPYQNER